MCVFVFVCVYVCCLHQVCHLRLDDGCWVLFNDEKVTLTKDPPLDLGYIDICESI